MIFVFSKIFRVALPLPTIPRMTGEDEGERSGLQGGRSSRLSLHRDLFLEACDVAVDRRRGERASAELVAHQAVPAGDVAVDHELVPLLGMADIVDGHVVVLA